MPNIKSTVMRSFYYYDISLLKNDKGKPVKISNQEDLFYKIFNDIKKIQKRINKGTANSNEIEVNIYNGDKIYILVDNCDKNKPIEFRLILCRVDALPLVERNGILNFLSDYLPKNFTLAEITHCIIFPEYGIMGAEYNFSGARATAIKAYLPKITSIVDYVYCANKLDDKVLRKLKKNEKLSLFELSIKNGSEAMKKLMNEKSIFTLPFAQINDVDTYEITLKRKKTKTHQGFDSPIPFNEIDSFIQEYREDIKSFKISQGSVQKDKIDLLSDKLVKKCEMARTENKTIVSEDAYNIIKNFYDLTVKPVT